MDSQTYPSTNLDIYQLVTDQIIEQFEKGVIPWQKPWADAGMPMNLLSKRHYRGINLWLLLTLPYERHLYLTWEQVKSAGGSVLAGEHGHIVVFWKPVQKKGDEQKDDKAKYVPMLRYYKVFNVAQCRDLPEHLVPEGPEPKTEVPVLEQCEAIVAGMTDRPAIVHKEAAAFYRPDTDIINMPKKKAFTSLESYYRILYHELIHSTGAAKRLNRKTLVDMVPFGSVSYAMEELIAEMGSAFLAHLSGILPNEITNTVAYLDNWLDVFKKDKRFLITAAGQAQKAADWMLGKKEMPKDEKEETNTESD